MTTPPLAQIRTAVRTALDEDLALGDVTTAALFPDPIPARGTILTHDRIVVAGMAAARRVFAEVDDALRVLAVLEDGHWAEEGSTLLTIEGDARSMLKGERVALNFLQHLSGIATMTAGFCEALRGYGTKVLDTRKTLPGLRALEKWAVRLGGGQNHRHSLGDGLLIKDNHLALLRPQEIGPADACRRARERGPHGLRVIVEAHSLEDVRGALEGEADVILLDNMTPETVRTAVDLIKGRAVVEVSGGITLENAVQMAAAGAHALSIGALTHSAPAANLSMDMVPVHQ